MPETEIGAPTRAEHGPGPSYRLRRLDTFSWAIERRSTRKDGTPGSWRIDGYFPRLELAAQRMFDRLMLDGDELRTLEELIQAVIDARDHIVQVVQNVQ